MININSDLSIYQIIRQNALKNPEKLAILGIDNLAITYHNLLVQIEKNISQIQSFGINKQDKIALILPNGVAMAVSFLGVSCAAISTPLNPNYRASEFEFYLSDIQAKALITQDNVAPEAIEIAQKSNIPVIKVINNQGIFDLQSADLIIQKNPEIIYPQSEDIALILHTSGTTSRPKQVPLTHFNLCNSAYNISQTLNLKIGDRCLNVMPLFHIHGLIGCLLASMQASSNIICTPGFKSNQFLTWLETFKPTWYSAVPTIHQAILTEAKNQPPINNTLRFIRSSSASLPSFVMKDLENTFNVPVIEAYGMTEASHQMTSNPLPPQIRKPLSVGVARGLEVAIMDEIGNFLKIGEIGEVVIKGKNVTQGYLNNSKANKISFINGWFKTGDLGYLDEDNYLFLQGRIKEIINRGGEKIMPLEIDNKIMEIPEIYQAVTFALLHPTLGEDVVTAVVLKPNHNITPEAIRNYLFTCLADFKIPTQVIIVDEIPKGATGKLQRIGLAEKLASALQKPSTQPTNEIEEIIAEIFQEILTINNISIYDNFFALGGDSLKGTQIINRINAFFNLNLSNVIIFRKPTIAELSAEIMQNYSTN